MLNVTAKPTPEGTRWLVRYEGRTYTFDSYIKAVAFARSFRPAPKDQPEMGVPLQVRTQT